MGRINFKGALPLTRRGAAMDYRVFVATLQATQLATPTAQAGSRACASGAAQGGEGSLPAILLGAKDWQEAVLARGGSFNPLQASAVERL